VNDLTHDLLDDDRLIPLRRVAVPDAAEVAGSDDAQQETRAVSKSRRATLIERERIGVAAENAQREVEPEQLATHPLTGLRGFRLEPIPVDRPYSGRHDLARFLIEFALVMAFVYALIVAFVLLVAHVRGTPV
jgi:hypothetical protein